jgi:hypothetical protein
MNRSNGHEEPKYMLSDEQQYKALRDEILSNFTRIYTLLCAELTAGSAIIWRITSITDRDEQFILLVLIQILIAVGVFMTRSFYNDIFKISGYIIVFFEGNKFGWEQRVSRLDSIRLDRKSAKELRLPFSPLESTVSMLIYSVMAVASLVVGYFKVGQSSETLIIMTSIFIVTTGLIIWFRCNVPKLARIWIQIWERIADQEKHEQQTM